MSNEQHDDDALIARDSRHQQMIDLATASFRGFLSQIPVAGPMLSEILGVYIPNRRLERVITMLTIFAHKIEHIEENIRNVRLQSDPFADLLEEGVIQAARSLSDERRRYIATLLAHSLSEEALTNLQQRRLLELLGSLNDAEILTLKFDGLEFNDQEQQAFLEKHRDVLAVPILVFGHSQDAHDATALQSTYRANLTRLGLIEPRFKKPKKGEPPDFDLGTGMITAAGYRITSLGRLLLRYIEDRESE